MLRLKDICKRYKDGNSSFLVLDGASLDLENGGSISIQGPSGCGKSTLLHLIGALDKPDSGTIAFTPANNATLDIHNFTEHQADDFRRKNLGVVFQRFNLIDCISVQENIRLPGRLNDNLDEHYIASLCGTLGISRLLNKFPTQLSGGEQQRVAIARALAHKPDLVLADEPTGNLDEENSNIVSKLLFDTCQKLNTTLIVVTHSEAVAKQAQRQLVVRHKKLADIHA
ncbi:ABC transporter ATP-binding protein [Glaciecola sp. XM2]|uniref:ABC transporter ATP-binding protein n=1 Tax=Glaciecola sp. XM2 TaxID=1914931 RepID=UPI001BDF6849|nr:ABC transporter ATP-binding protein [Glaciecola sp. XM2]